MWFFGGFGGLRISIRVPEVQFLMPQKCLKTPRFSHFGGTKNSTSGARNEILRPLFLYKLAPKKPQKVTSGTKIGPQKVIFGPFIAFEYFTIEIPIDAEKNY